MKSYHLLQDLLQELGYAVIGLPKDKFELRQATETSRILPKTILAQPCLTCTGTAVTQLSSLT